MDEKRQPLNMTSDGRGQNQGPVLTPQMLGMKQATPAQLERWIDFVKWKNL